MWQRLIVVALIAPIAWGSGTPARGQTTGALSISLAHQVVEPGQMQVVAVQSTPGAALALAVSFPDGRTVGGSLHLGASGRGQWTFKQPRSTITHTSRVAVVTARYSDGSPEHASALYTVGYGPLDVAVGLAIDTSARIDVWAHAAGGASISPASSPDCGLASGPPVADRSGWVEYSCTISLPPPSNTYRITVSARVAGRSVAVTRRLTMPEAAYASIHVDDLKLFIRQGSSWVPSPSIPLSRAVRLAVLYHATESAGIWFPPCPSGTVTVKQGSRVLWSGGLACLTVSGGEPPIDGPPYVYLDTVLSDPADVGPVDVVVSLSYSGHGDTRTFGESVVAGTPPAP